MSRWKAAGIHVAISACIALVAALLIFGLWYPAPYRKAAGGDVLVLLLIGVNFVIGPLLTLIVYKAGKRGMRFDLTVIALLQVCAFFYGMSVIVQARPAFIVAAVDRFVLVSANELDTDDLAKGSKPEFRSISWTGPRLVGAQLPTDTKARDDLLFSGLAGKDIEKYPEDYVDYAKAAPDLLKHAKPIDELLRNLPDARGEVESFLRDHHIAAADVVWLPMRAPRADLTVFVRRDTGTLIGALPLDPW